MKLTVISHKQCWKPDPSREEYFTDGGFPLQMNAIAGLFDSIEIAVPVTCGPLPMGVAPLVGGNMKIVELSPPAGSGIRRRVLFIAWLLKNGTKLVSSVARADAVHAIIPGDVGTIGMFAAIALRKRLFVRHCGNWLAPRTAAERFWKRSMEFFAGGRNVMFATGGGESAPSVKNPNIQWIFSTSLTRKELDAARPREFPGHAPRLITASRLVANKGTEVVIEAFVEIAKSFPGAMLDIVGDGPLMDELNEKVKVLGIEDKVIFYGRVEQDRVVGLMRNAHVFCYPTTASEGFPKVVLEALSAGLPVVTTRVSILPTLISRGCGRLLDNPDPAELAVKIVDVVSNKANYEKMSRAAVVCSRKFSLENWAEYIGSALRHSWDVAQTTSPLPDIRQESLNEDLLPRWNSR